ncbi:MAG TPA: DMT family transporter [Anaerolineales bacterium]|nr:DMT family transporter [Anaerolineales bacterium]
MPIELILLLLLAAVAHTAWNLLLKQSSQRYLISWWALLMMGVLLLPIALWLEPAPARWMPILPLLLLSAGFEAAYYWTLMSAYQKGDFGLVYPIARGTAPIWISLWAALFLGERISPLGGLGIGLIVAGLALVGSESLWRVRSAIAPRLSASSVLLALSVSLFISLYSTLDARAVHQISPFPYTVMVLLVGAVLLAPLVLQKFGWQASLKSLKTDGWRILAVGALTLTAYGLTLTVYRTGKLSYAGAVREISIVLAAWMGWQFLGEKISFWRAIGACIVFAGVVWLAILG